MIPSIKGWPSKTKEAPSPHEARLAQLDTNPVFQSLVGNVSKDSKPHELPSQCSRSTYPSSPKENEAEIMKLIKKRMSIAHSITNSFSIFFEQ